VNRLLPPTSIWRQLLDILKRRGASEYFRKQQRESISRMRLRFDDILDDAMYVTTRASIGRSSSSSMGEPAVSQLLKSIDSIAKNIVSAT